MRKHPLSTYGIRHGSGENTVSKCAVTPLKGADVVLLLWRWPPDFFTDKGNIDTLSRFLAVNDESEEGINRLLSGIDFKGRE